MTGPVKHATASVFLFDRSPSRHGGNGSPRVGLIYHPRLSRWMIPGGHVEIDENPAEAALREVLEETGHAASFVTGDVVACPAMVDERPVPLPWWSVEQNVPAERREPNAHVHVDHLYVALADLAECTRVPELAFEWFGADELDALDLFSGTRACLRFLYERWWPAMS